MKSEICLSSNRLGHLAKLVVAQVTEEIIANNKYSFLALCPSDDYLGAQENGRYPTLCDWVVLFVLILATNVDTIGRHGVIMIDL